LTPAVIGRHRETRLRAEERLVLHAHLEVQADHHRGVHVLVTLANLQVAQQVSLFVDLRR